MWQRSKKLRKKFNQSILAEYIYVYKGNVKKKYILCSIVGGLFIMRLKAIDLYGNSRFNLCYIFIHLIKCFYCAKLCL